MSSDLLAEFDSFYRAPQDGAKKDPAASLDRRSISAIEGFSSSGPSSLFQSKLVDSRVQLNIPVSKPSDDIWGNLEAFDAVTPQSVIGTSFSHVWGGVPPPGQSGNIGQQAAESKRADYGGRYHAEPSEHNPRIIRRPTIDLFSGNIIVEGDSASTRHQSDTLSSDASTRTKFPHIKTATSNNENSNVLFDAADELNREEEDDEFGDFETVSSHHPQIDLLQVESPIEVRKVMKKPSEILMKESSLRSRSFQYPQAPKSPSFRERNPFADLAVMTPSFPKPKAEDASKIESPMTAWPEYEPKLPAPGLYHDSLANDDPKEEEDWGDFEDLQTEIGDTKRPKTDIEINAWAWDAVDSQIAPVIVLPAEVLPPTNIPPPSVLLAIFPQLFNLPQSSLFQALSNQPFALKNRILSDPSTIDFLRAYILLATVAARIIAGRKLRWKRDTHLSQAMKIGPAVAHGKGGMKLTGVDKAETTREEREAAEVVRIWRDQVGRLRSAIATANSGLHDQSTHLAVPEITETMVVKTGGTLTAPKACVLCGLKREERITKVDFEVEDSFGEWWVEYWGHRACRNFWHEHETNLKQR